MRCCEAGKKLNKLKFVHSEIAQDKNLLKHLDSCSACSELVAAEKELSKNLHLAALDDSTDSIRWQDLQVQVNQQAATQIKSQFRENQLMSMFTNFFNKRPKLGLGISVITALVVLSILVPFQYNKTVGYEVAFAGVARDLALDSDRISQLLDKLGIEDAAVDVSNCEATCNLKITDLKNSNDAKLLVAAFGNIENVFVLDEIHELHETESGNIFKKIHFSISSGDDNDHDLAFFDDADGNYHKVLVEKLGDNPEEQIMFWVSGNADEANVHHLDPNSNEFFFFSEDGTGTMDLNANIGTDGVTSIIVNQGTPDEQTITIPDGPPSEETIKMLEQMGLTVHDLNGSHLGNDLAQGSLHKIVELKVSDTPVDDNESDDVTAKTTGNLPEGYVLHQNYPNPFNPTTNISFVIPIAQHVTIEVININGQRVKLLMDKTVGAGEHTIEWDATNESGGKVASGVYLYKLSTPSEVAVKKMTLMK